MLRRSSYRACAAQSSVRAASSICRCCTSRAVLSSQALCRHGQQRNGVMVDLNRKGAWRQLRVRTFETAFCVEGGLVVPGSVEWVGRVIGSQRQADAGCQIGRNRHAEPGSDGAAEDALETECRHTRWA